MCAHPFNQSHSSNSQRTVHFLFSKFSTLVCASSISALERPKAATSYLLPYRFHAQKRTDLLAVFMFSLHVLLHNFNLVSFCVWFSVRLRQRTHIYRHPAVLPNVHSPSPPPTRTLLPMESWGGCPSLRYVRYRLSPTPDSTTRLQQGHLSACFKGTRRKQKSSHGNVILDCSFRTQLSRRSIQRLPFKHQWITSRHPVFIVHYSNVMKKNDRRFHEQRKDRKKNLHARPFCIFLNAPKRKRKIQKIQKNTPLLVPRESNVADVH